MRRMRILAAAALLAACGTHHDSSGMYSSLEVEPAQATLSVALGGSATQAYQVFGIEGTTRTDITSDCALSIDSSFGAFAQATLTVGPHAGKTTVGATCGMLTGSAQVIVNLTGTIVLGPNTPAGAAGIFGAATPGSDPTRAPGLQYPLDHAVSPVNIPPIEIQWAAAGNDLFHISLASTFMQIDAYTSDLQATLADPDWQAVTQSAAGDTLVIGIEGLLQAAPAMKYAGAAVNLVMSQDSIDKTAIYYWASSVGDIMSQTFGTVTAPSVVKGDCTACHSVSRTASRIGYARCVGGDCNQLFAGFMKYDGMAMTWNETVNADAKAIAGSYTTFAPVGNPFPTDDQSVAMVTMSGGTLALYDPDTGAAIPSNLDVATHGPGAPRAAMMPDWSPDGQRVVFTSTPHPGNYIDLSDGSIATMSYDFTGTDHVFGEPQFIIPNPITLPTGSYTNFFFPSFSPDGALIVFDAARSGWRNFSDEKSAGQRLMLADGGGAWVVDLSALNGGNVDADITWAHWAPTASNDYYWVVFSSERDYGHEVTAANTAAPCVANGVKQCKQIWIGAIARNRLTGQLDPSAPPMWLPGQDPKTDNISPYWSVPTGLQ